MREGIRLQNRDIELLIFLGKYKIISLDNTRYIYETVTYQEKRIVALAKYNYIRRLKHRYITLGIKGKEYLLENGFEIREHCRNENNIERLNFISDIASCLIQDNLNFIPSWNMKKEDEPTTHSRRYIGKLEYNNQEEFLVYAIYDGKDDKYIKSIYYDIRKENGYTNAMIFTNDIEKIVLHEKGFYFGNRYTVLVPYNEYGKFLVSQSKTDIENLECIKQKCELYLFDKRQRTIIENALDIMFYSKELKIGQVVLPRENVRSRMQILNASIIFYAFDKLNNLKPDAHISNSTNFMISCLYNAITEYYSDSDLQYRID